MDQQINLTDLLSTGREVSITSFAAQFAATAALCYLLGWLYIHRGHSLSNRASFGRNFVIIGTTTMLVIAIVKSSLALSLGLVGALSIVRFRTAIKEPEELGYLFLCIGIGLGFGADQWLVTLCAFAFIAGIIWLRGRPSSDPSRTDAPNLFLTVASQGPSAVGLEAINALLGRSCAGLQLKRFVESGDKMEASYLIRFNNHKQLEEVRHALRRLGDNLRITFVDNTGVL